MIHTEEINLLDDALDKMQELVTAAATPSIYPSGDHYVSDTGIMNSDSALKSANWKSSPQFGTVCQEKMSDKIASELMRTHNRLLKYVNQYGGNWRADWQDGNQEKYVIYYCHVIKRWKRESHTDRQTLGAVYMSKECADALVTKLKSDEYLAGWMNK